MVTGAEINALREANAVTKGNKREVVEPSIFGQPTGLTNLETPGELHTKAGLESAISADASPEETKQLHAPS